MKPSVSQTVVTKNLTGNATDQPTVCGDRNITVFTNLLTGLAIVKLGDEYDASLEPGQHTFRALGGHLNEICTTRVQVIDNFTGET